MWAIEFQHSFPRGAKTFRVSQFRSEFAALFSGK
jgi:hypothetical protein